MTPDGHRDHAETLAGQAESMLTGLAIPEGGMFPPRWSAALAYAQALSGLAQVHATLACAGASR